MKKLIAILCGMILIASMLDAKTIKAGLVCILCLCLIYLISDCIIGIGRDD